MAFLKFPTTANKGEAVVSGNRRIISINASSFAVNEVGVPFPLMPDLPYVTALVDLKEGPRMISTIVECDFKDLRNGMDLEVVFDDISPEFALPKWRPVKK